ncbi:lytic transglycosylase domain-containing protein [Shouchella patagoniensis]|uniref:lytic transglycosylase domain-containing protein n=1 Tax=Shouchella patagoniensis TaxID=228576 RepID=UPI0009953C8F|nr:lytic transglycosylase domain-containing protein [Shouchella patagoniensis]
MRKWLYSIALLGVMSVIIIVLLFEQNDRFRQGVYKTMIAENQIPEEYVPIYQEASDEYGIPWELLASVHRVETIFSTMDPLVSPVGALGHFQFMPRTWVGWTYPGVDDIGNIDEETDITDTFLIEEHQGYGTDAKGTGQADPFDLNDSAHAAARYLADHGATEGDFEQALFSYNKSEDYVEEVLNYYQTYIEQGYELISIPFQNHAE